MTNPQDLPKLTPKQEGFVQSYMESGVAVRAYREHYGSDKMSDNTARRNAHALLHKDTIQTTLELRKAKKDAKREEIEEKARKHASDALQTLVSIAADPKAPSSSRVAAAGAVLDRAHGKPISKTELDATLNKGNGTASDLTDEQLMAMLGTKGEG